MKFLRANEKPSPASGEPMPTVLRLIPQHRIDQYEKRIAALKRELLDLKTAEAGRAKGDEPTPRKASAVRRKTARPPVPAHDLKKDAEKPRIIRDEFGVRRFTRCEETLFSRLAVLCDLPKTAARDREIRRLESELHGPGQSWQS